MHLYKYSSRELDADRYTCIYENSNDKKIFETCREICFRVRSLLPYSIIFCVYTRACVRVCARVCVFVFHLLIPVLNNANKYLHMKGISVELIE